MTKLRCEDIGYGRYAKCRNVAVCTYKGIRRCKQCLKLEKHSEKLGLTSHKGTVKYF